MTEEEKDFIEIEKRSDAREKLLEKIVKDSEIIQNFPEPENFLILARQWNSWYPSSFDVAGGTYFFNLNEEIIIIDPGFNTLEEIKKRDLDIRLIRHVFVTHFHPDHFENLVKIITRITSKKNKITVYLNSTAYHQFKIYSRSFTEFFELRPGILVNIAFEKKNPELEVSVEVGKAFHKEIGGATNSVGLKFTLKLKKNNQKIVFGFMSDTDGTSKYIDNYLKFYDNCNIIVLHLGALHKQPTGYSHLYKEGITNFLASLKDKDKLKNKIIFIGEFGFELASEHYFKNAFEEIIPKNLKYQYLIDSILEYLNTSDREYFLGRLYASLFQKCIQKIWFLYPTLELISPFFIPKKNGDNHEAIIDYITNLQFNQQTFETIWNIYIKTLIFEAKPLNEALRELESIAKDIFGNEVLLKFIKTLQEFFKYFDPSIKKWLISKLKSNPNIWNLDLAIISEFIKYNVADLTRADYDSDPIEHNINIVHFLGVINRRALSKPENEKLDLITILMFALFVLNLWNYNDFLYPSLGESDGRVILCKYFYNKFKLSDNLLLLLPVHPSYKIILNSDQIILEGFCSERHKQKIPIFEYNRDWHLHEKNFNVDNAKNGKENLEYINVIPNNLCNICLFNKWIDMDNMSEEDYDKMRDEYLMEQQKELEVEVEKINREIRESNDIMVIILIISKIKEDVVLSGVDGNMLIEKINELTREIPSRNLIKLLIDLNFLKIEKVLEFLKEKIDLEYKRDNNFVKSLVLDLISEHQGESKDYLSYFDIDDFSTFLISKVGIVDFENILKISNYLAMKCLNQSNNDRKSEFEFFIKNSNFFKFYKENFIKLFFPLIQNPDDQMDKYSLLMGNTKILDEISQFGTLFNTYRTLISFQIVKILRSKKSYNTS